MITDILKNKSCEKYKRGLILLKRNSTLFLSLVSVACGVPLFASGIAYGVEQKLSSPNSEAVIHQLLPYLNDVQQTPVSIDKINQIEEEGEKFLQSHQLDRALAKFQEAYGQSLETKYAEGEGLGLTDMCRVYVERGQFVKAKYLGENAIEVLQSVSDKVALGKARVALAQAYFGLDNPSWAVQQLDQALTIFTSESGNNGLEMGKVMNLAGTLLRNVGSIKEAIKYYQEAAAAFSQGGDIAAAINNRITVASMFQELGLNTAALEEANKAAALARSTENNKALLVTALTSVANVQYTLCEYTSARKTYEQVLELASQLASDQLTDESRASINAGYGFVLSATGDPEQAKQFLDKAINGLKAAGTSYERAVALNGLAIIEEGQGQHAKALQLLSQGVDLVPLIRPRQDRLHVLMLQNMAFIESRLGNNRDARGHLNTALEVLKRSPDVLLIGRTYSALGEVSLLLQDPPQAEAFLKHAIDVSAKINDDSALWRDYTLLAKIQIAQGQETQAKDSLHSAMSFFRSPQAGVFPSPERLNFPTTREDLGQQLVALVSSQNMPEQALLTAEQLKQEAFINEWIRRGGNVRQEDKDVYSDLVTQRYHLHAAEVSATPDKMLKDWQAWLARLRSLENSNRGLAELIAPVPVSINEIIKAVKDKHATMIDYLVGTEASVVFIIDSTGRITATVLRASDKELQNQVITLLSNSGSSGQTDANAQRNVLQSLYSELLPPAVHSLLPQNPDETLVIVPDGILFNLPFAALVDGQGKYLVEHHTLTMASSVNTFVDSPPRYSEVLNVVLITPAGAAEETDSISDVFQPSQVTKLSNQSIDISTIGEQMRGKAIIHCPADLHLRDNPLRAVFPFSTDGNQKVTADQLFGIKMPSDLMVLSASSVSTKDTIGNGVNVFSHGLRYAGVRNVLMSLWVEPGPQRIEELVDFYKNTQSGMNQAQSLRKAELLALSKDSAPRSWAAFQLVGPGY
jgi:CHAT domain-containing protein/Tfp pilus assembly protein PilF